MVLGAPSEHGFGRQDQAVSFHVGHCEVVSASHAAFALPSDGADAHVQSGLHMIDKVSKVQLKSYALVISAFGTEDESSAICRKLKVALDSPWRVLN